MGKTFTVEYVCSKFYIGKCLYISFNLDKKNNTKYKFNEQKTMEEVIYYINNELNGKDSIFKWGKENNIDVINNDWLFIFDEIQVFPNLKKVIDLFPKLEPMLRIKVICTGSYLTDCRSSDPKYKSIYGDKHLVMYPMNFEEFLLAANRNDLLVKSYECVNSIKQNLSKLDSQFHNEITKYYEIYLSVGGFPNIVKAYFDLIKNEINQDDFNWTIHLEQEKINQYIDSDENNAFNPLIKLEFKILKQNISKRQFEINYKNALINCINCKLVFWISNIDNLLSDELIINKFNKIYVNDTRIFDDKQVILQPDGCLSSGNSLKSGQVKEDIGMIGEIYFISQIITKASLTFNLLDNISNYIYFYYFAIYEANKKNPVVKASKIKELMRKKLITVHDTYEIDFVLKTNKNKNVIFEIKNTDKAYTRESINALLKYKFSNKTKDIPYVVFCSKDNKIGYTTSSINQNIKEFYIPLYLIPFLEFDNKCRLINNIFEEN